MGCVLILVLMGLPRVALIALWLFRDGYLSQAFDGVWAWPVLGFLFLPTTTLAFSYSMNSLGDGGQLTPLGWVLTAIGLLLDLGVHGGGARDAQRRQVRS